MSTLKKRGVAKKANLEPKSVDELEDIKVKTDTHTNPAQLQKQHYIACAVITLIAGYLRFTNLSWPDKVVFDEVHFGKFASYYLEGSYFFDLHPPFAKLLIAFVGFLNGYDGAFKFDNIGDEYSKHSAPYVAYRALSAIQGTVTVPVLYWTLKTLRYTPAACFLASAFVALDTAHTIDSRLILLDATLILTVALSIFSYAKFSIYRKNPFSTWWWIWLYATGISLSLVISTKYVGVFTFITIGVAVIHELWYLLDYKKKIPLEDLIYHFFARAWALIAVPFIIYLFWFYIHFQVLTTSGPGDSFMSSEFQDTLQESEFAESSKPVQYYDMVTFVHKDTDCFLHSHDFVYPLRYEDGRISSNTQQVTCVFDEKSEEKDDVNNWWEIVPTVEGVDHNNRVRTEDVVRLRHVGTGGFLLTHDVASPLKATHEEFTIAHNETAVEKYQQTLFKFKYTDASNSKKEKKVDIKTRSGQFKLVHVDTVVAMWTHDDEVLPPWGFGHQEVSGNKKITDGDNTWTIQHITNLDESDKRNEYVPKVIKPLPFLKKWWELQFLMFKHNNMLSSEHPFASQPDSWPLAVSGVSFWNDNELKQQIFFVGNVIGFWIQVALLAIYVGIILADQITRRRGIYILTDKARSRLYNTLGFLFIGWCAHYFPFYLMGRQKFLHHYLPAHLIAALFSGALVEFLCSENRIVGGKVRNGKILIITIFFVIGMAGFFWYFSPIVYGNVYLTPEEIQKRQWLDIKLHYAK